MNMKAYIYVYNIHIHETHIYVYTCTYTIYVYTYTCIHDYRCVLVADLLMINLYLPERLKVTTSAAKIFTYIHYLGSCTSMYV